MSSPKGTGKRKRSATTSEPAKKKNKIAGRKSAGVSLIEASEITVTSRPPGVHSRSNFLKASAWAPPVRSAPQTFMYTEAGAAAAVLARTIWFQDADNVNLVAALRAMATLINDASDAELLRLALDNRAFSSGVAEASLPLGGLVNETDNKNSQILENDVANALIQVANNQRSCSSAEGSATTRVFKQSIGVLADCARCFNQASRALNVFTRDGLDACSARNFYVNNITEYGDETAVATLVRDTGKLDALISVMEGSTCLISNCKRKAIRPIPFCSKHYASIKQARADGDAGDRAETRRRIFELLDSKDARKRIKSAIMLQRRFRRSGILSGVEVSKAGRVVVYDASADKEHVPSYDVESVNLVPRQRGVSSTPPLRFQRKIRQLIARDRDMYSKSILVMLPWFEIVWACAVSEKTADDSDFEDTGAGPKLTKAVVGTCELQECCEAMSQGIVRSLYLREGTYSEGSNTDRVSRHSSLWPADVKTVLQELATVISLIDPVCTYVGLSIDDPTTSYTSASLADILENIVKLCSEVSASVDAYIGSSCVSNAVNLAAVAKKLTSFVATARTDVPRWAAVKRFNTDPVYGSLACILAAVCVVVQRWSSMPTYVPLPLPEKADGASVWTMVHECSAATITLLGYFANDVSVAMDEYPTELSEYGEIDCQIVAVLQTRQYLAKMGINPSILVHLSNEPLEKKVGDCPSDPTFPGMVKGICTDDRGLPYAEVAQWPSCLDPLGYGVRAKASIPAGTIIAEVHFRVHHTSKRSSPFTLIDDQGCARCIDDRNIIRWMNAADFKGSTSTPNCDVVFARLIDPEPTVHVVASVQIDAGEELTMVYGKTFTAPYVVTNDRSAIPPSAVRCFNADETIMRFGRRSGLLPSWKEKYIESFTHCGSEWAASRWEIAEHGLPVKHNVSHFYSVNSSESTYYSALEKMAVDIPESKLVVPRDSNGNTIARPGGAFTASDFFKYDKSGRVITGLKDDFNMAPYGANALSYHGLREVSRVSFKLKGRHKKRFCGSTINEAIRRVQVDNDGPRATVTDAYIRKSPSDPDHATKCINEHSLLLKADVCQSIQEIEAVGPCILRSYLDPALTSQDKVVPAQQTLHGMNNCSLYATYNHVYEGIWHIEPDSAISLNENMGTEDGFVIMITDPKAIRDVSLFHLFMELAVPGGVDISWLRSERTPHGVLHDAHRGRSWLSRPPHKSLLAKFGIDVSTYVVYRQRPGEIIYIPGGTLHAVVHKSPSVRVATGYLGMAEACRSILRADSLENEGAMSTLWSVAGSVQGGDVDIGVAFERLATDHRQHSSTPRWRNVNMEVPCKLLQECAEVIQRTSGYKKKHKPKRRPGKKLRGTPLVVEKPAKLTVGSGAGAKYMVTLSKWKAAVEYFSGLHGKQCTSKEPASSSSSSATVADQQTRRITRSSPSKAGQLNDPDVVIVTANLRSKNALSDRQPSSFVKLYERSLLKASVMSEFVNHLRDDQVAALRASMSMTKLGQQSTLVVALGLLEVACFGITCGNPVVLFQDPKHQDACDRAIKNGTSDDVARALQLPPVRDVPGNPHNVHVFTLHVGNPVAPDHFVSVVCRGNSQGICWADSAPSHHPRTRTSAIKQLQRCLTKAQFFEHTLMNLRKATVAEQPPGDMSCMERSTLNAAWIACYATPPYRNVTVPMVDQDYADWNVILRNLLDDVRPTGALREDEDTPVNIDTAIDNAGYRTVRLLKRLDPSNS